MHEHQEDVELQIKGRSDMRETEEGHSDRTGLHDVPMQRTMRPSPLIADADDEYFTMMSQIPGMWGWKAPDHRYICASVSMAQLLGFDRQEDINGRPDWNLPCGARECADAYHVQDHLVIQKRVPLRILDVARFAGDEWRVQITTKFPLLNRKKTVIGISFHVVSATSLGAFELQHLLEEEYQRLVPEVMAERMHVGASSNVHKMTSRESEVLFFLLRGHNAKMIARVLGISHRTVERHLDSLKQRFGVTNKFDLIHAAIAQGYFDFLPASLLRKQRSIILDNGDPRC